MWDEMDARHEKRVEEIRKIANLETINVKNLHYNICQCFQNWLSLILISFNVTHNKKDTI